jgi:hypothetical protein
MNEKLRIGWSSFALERNRAPDQASRFLGRPEELLELVRRLTRSAREYRVALYRVSRAKAAAFIPKGMHLPGPACELIYEWSQLYITGEAV